MDPVAHQLSVAGGRWGYVLVEGTAGASTLAKVTGGADTTIDTADVTLIAHFFL